MISDELFVQKKNKKFEKNFGMNKNTLNIVYIKTTKSGDKKNQKSYSKMT